ncbi:Alpha/Beta hydrolase protein [Aspergillus ambiguus]|uniref:lipase family protein n=1 Tax=Aspergillus ambiguus TaxID=176160 RepID=UPI003CCCBDD9
MSELESQLRECLSSSVNVYGVVLKKLDDVITAMDEGRCTPRDDMIMAYPRPEAEKSITPALGFFSKVYLYQNARLPPYLPPLQIHPQTYTLIHLAAQHSLDVYSKPAAADAAYITPKTRHGTKATLIKTHAIDDIHTIIISIRGTQTFRDWTVNMRTSPRSPSNFLDDPLNLVHAGFLSVAQKMTASVAARLRTLLTESPSRASYSLLFTGHSAGGAVAALLYAHMRSTTSHSDLTHLHGFFRRVHCVTFGAPPITLRPLYAAGARDAIFFSFVNEGDPVPRADKGYVTSLMNLYVAPAPAPASAAGPTRREARLRLRGRPVVWRVPAATLSVAGLVVVLRHGQFGMEACVTSDTTLRQVVFGDPLMHMMDLYARRIYELALSKRTK